MGVGVGRESARGGGSAGSGPGLVAAETAESAAGLAGFAGRVPGTTANEGAEPGASSQPVFSAGRAGASAAMRAGGSGNGLGSDGTATATGTGAGGSAMAIAGGFATRAAASRRDSEPAKIGEGAEGTSGAWGGAWPSAGLSAFATGASTLTVGPSSTSSVGIASERRRWSAICPLSQRSPGPLTAAPPANAAPTSTRTSNTLRIGGLHAGGSGA